MKIKKISLISAALAALLLTSCAAENTESTGVSSAAEITSGTSESAAAEDTSETAGAAKTANGEPAAKVPLKIESYDPIAEVAALYKDNKAVQEEMSEAAEKLSDAAAFRSGNFTAFGDNSKYRNNYADTETVLEVSGKYEDAYSPLNPEIASTEEELFDFLRSCFTENFISDEQLKKELFEPISDDVGPNYKTIDGTLCMKVSYGGVYTRINGDEIAAVTEYSENSAEIIAVGYDTGYPPYHAFMKLVKSPEYGWQLDGLEYRTYNYIEAEMMYNAVTLKTDKLNMILGGGNVPENAAEITEDGEIYTQTDTGMSIDEMREFFGESFSSKETYTEKYIDSVYAERDGVLYRRSNAPKYYLPKMDIDPYDICGTLWSGNFIHTTSEQTFTDADGKSFSSEITLFAERDGSEAGKLVYTALYIDSELPIRELGGEASAENITPVYLSGKAEDITDEQLKKLYEYAYETVRGKEFLKDSSGSFLTKEGKNLDEYKEEFKQTFTDRYADEYFKLEKGGTYFRDGSQFLELFVLRKENSVDDISVFGGYSGIWVGFGDKGSDLSVRDNELTVTSRSDGKIVLTMTVWHVDPENELKIGEDYAYRLENGNLVIAGKFGGWDENGDQIVIDGELSGTIAEVPVGSGISEFYNKRYKNYLVKYDYDLVLDDGVWKFDNFYIWD